jgi:hypothetical protein
MEKIELGLALIRKLEQQVLWLGKFNDAKEQIDFVTAKRLEKETFREAITREVAWELEIDRRRDFVVSSMAQLNINFITTLPGNSDTTQVAAAFYNVELYRRAVIEKIGESPKFVWLNSTEVCDGISKEGIKLDPLLVLLNQEAHVIQHWESDVTGDG